MSDNIYPEEPKLSKEEAIAYCRKNSMRRKGVLHYAAENCPLAFAEWMKGNRYNGFAWHFKKLGIDVPGISPWSMFAKRERQLEDDTRSHDTGIHPRAYGEKEGDS